MFDPKRPTPIAQAWMLDPVGLPACSPHTTLLLSGVDACLGSTHRSRMERSTPPIAFDNSFARLPNDFFVRTAPSPVPAPRLLSLNEPLAESLGIDVGWLRSAEGVASLAGNHVPAGADPLAMAYAGHQFGNFVPQLGDGRALLMGEVIDDHGVRQDIQWKGAGRTPFSRGGDGRNWIGPVLREFVVSEAMAALGVPTTRALAAVATGEQILREEPRPGAVLVRVARSHVRVGTFQYFTARRDLASVATLARHVAERNYPETLSADLPTLALLDAVVTAQAALVAHWQSIGFIHGVMNTDNSSVTGDTIDYGPCAFMDEHVPDKVFSSIDHGGRYAFSNQPHLAQWNLANLAQCLLPLIEQEMRGGDDARDKADFASAAQATQAAPDAATSDPSRQAAIDAAQGAVDAFTSRFEQAWLERFSRKLGIRSPREEDASLVTDLLDIMAADGADFTLTFRHLGAAPGETHKAFDDPGRFDVWHDRWLTRVGDDGCSTAERQRRMKRVNPAVIPRNHQVEAMIRSAIDDDDVEPLRSMLAVLAAPFDEAAEGSTLARPPEVAERVTRTFCGT